MNYIGIDPGKDGAIVAITEKGIEKIMIPLIGKEIDLHKLNYEIKRLSILGDGGHFVLENVHTLPIMSAKSNFTFGSVFGMLQALLVANDCKFTLVTPKEWQKEMWQGVPKQLKVGKKQVDTKAMSLLAANRLFPHLDLTKSERASKAHDGIVDALLMAEYCKRKFGI
jgi:hypothetical protein